MIGQQKLKKQIENWVNKSDNRFIIICGLKGSGKKEIIKYIARCLKADLVVADNKIDSVRECIKTSYTQQEKIIYAFYDVDKMSFQAKNSLLKITEEPPKKAYFILTMVNEFTLPKTLHSRASVFRMENYSVLELMEYAESIKDFNKEEIKIISMICDTPGDVNYFLNNDVVEFYNFLNLVVDNIAEVSGANAFKITNKIKTKEDGEGIDALFFLKTCANLFITHENTNTWKNYKAWKITSDAINSLSINGINKQFLIDNWILNIRDNFLEELED